MVLTIVLKVWGVFVQERIHRRMVRKLQASQGKVESDIKTECFKRLFGLMMKSEASLPADEINKLREQWLEKKRQRKYNL